MDNITQARHNFVLAFQYCWNGDDALMVIIRFVWNACGHLNEDERR